jgi:hypothetical protein
MSSRRFPGSRQRHYNGAINQFSPVPPQGALFALLKPALTVVFAALCVTTVQAQYTESVLWSFVGGPSGDGPDGIVRDSEGNIYGTTFYGGSSTVCPYTESEGGCGTVYELSPPAGGTSVWTQTVLYSFCSLANCVDGYLTRKSVRYYFSGWHRFRLSAPRLGSHGLRRGFRAYSTQWRHGRVDGDRTSHIHGRGRWR